MKAITASKGNATTYKDPMIYVNSAWNDLIRSTMQEKQECLQYIQERINSTIDLEELQIFRTQLQNEDRHPGFRHKRNRKILFFFKSCAPPFNREK